MYWAVSYGSCTIIVFVSLVVYAMNYASKN